MGKDATRAFGDRRATTRHPVRVDVNYRHGDTYLFSHSKDLSELGIFVVADDPLPMGSRLDLRFDSPDGGEPITVEGEVMWVESGQSGRIPGMGIRFVQPSEDVRRKIRALIRTVAYLE